MIKQDQVISLVLESCPSFRSTWEHSNDQDLLYVVMGDLARHLLVQFRDKQTDEFKPLCSIIERLHIEGDPYVRELATIGFLEGIQNVWSNSNEDPEQFCKFLLPESQKWWKELNDFWEGKTSYVGQGIAQQLASAKDSERNSSS
jgi:hypothetical protein